MNGDYLEDLINLINEDDTLLNNEVVESPNYFTKKDLFDVAQSACDSFIHVGKIDSFINDWGNYRELSNGDTVAHIDFSVRKLKVFKIKCTLHIAMMRNAPIRPDTVYNEIKDNIERDIKLTVKDSSIFKLWKEGRIQ